MKHLLLGFFIIGAWSSHAFTSTHQESPKKDVRDELRSGREVIMQEKVTGTRSCDLKLSYSEDYKEVYVDRLSTAGGIGVNYCSGRELIYVLTNCDFTKESTCSTAPEVERTHNCAWQEHVDVTFQRNRALFNLKRIMLSGTDCRRYVDEKYEYFLM